MPKQSPKKPSTADLARYAKRGGKPCGICQSPYRQFIEQSIAEGFAKPAVRQYLIDEFGAQLPSNMGHHFNSGHHLNGRKKA